MSIKLIAFDLDGTFLDDQKNCIKENMDALRAAAARGVHIVPSTGRMYNGIPEPIRELPFVRYAIAINGAEVYDRQEDRVIYRAEIPMEDAERIFDYAATLPALYDCYQGSQGYMEREFYEHAHEMIEDKVICKLVRSLREPVDNFRQFVRGNGSSVQKIQLMFKDLERKQEELEKIPKLFPGYVTSASLYNNIEINISTANKGEGLKALCDHLGLSLSEAMALGDGGNDITMLQMAGVGIAMGNASDKVKAHADVVVGTNEQAGVAEAIRKFVLEQ